jgi:hypothetical protein
MSTPRLCLAVVSDLFKGQQFVFDGHESITIGRTVDNKVVLDHKSVSRRHACIEPNGGAYVLKDLGSHNGTRVGDQLVSEHVLQPGDVIGLGEIQLSFMPITAGGGAETASTLPAVMQPEEGAAGALARPLSFDEIFAQARATPTAAVPKPSRIHWPLVYGVALVAVIVFGLLGFWYVGRSPVGLPIVGVQLRVGDVRPVNLAWVPDPAGRGLIQGLERVEEIGQPVGEGVDETGQPAGERVAYARRTKFRTFVAVRGKALGTTDIPITGAPVGRVLLRVLVRGTKPPSQAEIWMAKPPGEQRQHAHALIERTRPFRRRGGPPDQHTAMVIRDLELAARLLGPFPDEGRAAADAAGDARIFRKNLADRFDQLARRIYVLEEQGRLKEAELAARELVELFQDPETEEYYIVRSKLESLTQQILWEDRERQERH